jgi:hypothetical protein
MDENKFWDQEIENRQRRKQHPFLDKCTAMIRDKYRDLYRWKYFRAPTLSPLVRNLTSLAPCIREKHTTTTYRSQLLSPFYATSCLLHHVSRKNTQRPLIKEKKYERLAASTLGLRHEQNEHSAPA